MSKLFKASLIMTVFFGINKIVALVRQYLVTKQFGLAADIDAYNVSNNLPDLLFSLIAGSALALAIIPVLTEYFDKEGRARAWQLFSRITNLVFLSTAVLAVLVGVFAYPLIGSELGIAPGFTAEQKELTVQLMRLNLVATLIFSISGLVMAGLQANKHFLLPAVAPILYNVGQIIGVVVIAPLLGNGVFGLAYGVIVGAMLHLAVQLPGLMKYQFHWLPSLGLRDEGVRRVLVLMGPRILTVLCIQIMFIMRDNLASRLPEGTVSALTYGYYILQVPETLIGTAIGTALLPTLSEFAEEHKKKEFGTVLNKTIRVMFALTFIITVIAVASVSPFISALFGFSKENTQLLVTVTNAYMIGLFTQCLLEVTTRAFYAQQDAKTPFLFTIGRLILYIVLSVIFLRPLGSIGLALADTITVTLVVLYSLYLLQNQNPGLLRMNGTGTRTLIACIASGVTMWGVITFLPLSPLLVTTVAVSIAGALSLFIIRDDVKMLVKL